jgi:excisionase family DNA binding protein
MSSMPDVLTAAEAASFLRTRPETLKRLAREGKVPGVKLGHEWRFLREDLVDLLAGTHGAQAEEDRVSAGAALQPVGGAHTLPDDLRDKIMGLARPRNWDGEGAQGITVGTCRDAVELAQEVQAAARGLPWPVVGLARWGAIMLTWQVDDRAVTVYLSTGDAGRYSYQWEGPEYACGEGEGSRSEVIGVVAELQPRQVA